eukprot:scaffold65647_cov58-Cyclotella_meneghiniana.AAC.1
MNNSIDDDSPPHTINIGRGHQLFNIKLSIETFRNPSQIIPLSHHNPCWLSYRFMGRVVQSEILSCNTPNPTTSSASFTPMIHTFRVCSSYRELMQHFHDKKNGALRVHVCTTGRVLGTAVIDLLPLFEKREGSKTEEEIDLLDGGGRMVSGEYDVRPLNEMNSSEDGTNTALTIYSHPPREYDRRLLHKRILSRVMKPMKIAPHLQSNQRQMNHKRMSNIQLHHVKSNYKTKKRN